MTEDEALAFYTSRYGFIDPFFLRPGDKRIVLGDRQNRQCRFCGGTPPTATFRMEAHAIPEAFGNKTLFSAYECDACNQTFGRGFENDFGNWSKPMRTFARIRGKNGVPTLKQGGDSPGWRIEYGASGFEIKQYESNPIFSVDEANKRVVFNLKRDAYTPIAVMKAFVKIGLTVMPAEEMENFDDALSWLRRADHERPFHFGSPGLLQLPLRAHAQRSDRALDAASQSRRGRRPLRISHSRVRQRNFSGLPAFAASRPMHYQQAVELASLPHARWAGSRTVWSATQNTAELHGPHACER